jgi:Lon protease-like protein
MQIPLFPLHAVLAPGLALPLHVFEPRYRAMVRHCLDTPSPFGVVLIREGSEVAPPAGEPQELAIAEVGTLAEIREASRYSDGRWDLVTVGGGRFRIREVRDDLAPYLVAEVDLLEDGPGDASAVEALMTRVTRRFVDYIRLLQPRDGEEALPIDVQVEVEVPDGDGEDEDADGDDDEADEAATGGESEAAPERGARPQADGLRIPDDPSALSFLLTGILQVEPDRKQALLEAATAEERLRELDGLLNRELLLLSLRLAPFRPDHRAISAVTN